MNVPIRLGGVKDVLVVDDDEDVRDALCEALQDEGFKVVSASNGRDALELLRDGVRPEIILLDLMMPVMDGWQFRNAQLDDPELARIPVVVITAAGSHLPQPIHASEILSKPLRVEQVVAAIARNTVHVAAPTSAE